MRATPPSPAEREALEQLLAELVATPSVNPWITPGAEGEGAVAELLAVRLGRLDRVDVSVEEIAPGRPNVIARVPGRGDGPTLCVNVHTDTVDCSGWEETAFTPRRQGGRMLGLGVADNKAQCAALALAVERLAATPADGDVVAVFAIDEEGPSSGTHKLVETLRADGALVLEPVGNGSVCVAHQGFGSLDLVVRAAAAHGLDDDSPDAIVQLAALVDGLAEIDRAVLARRVHPLVGKPFFHTGFVHGGTDYGTYPSEVRLGFEMGTVPGETLRDRIVEVESLIERVRRRHPTLDARLEVALDNDPFEAAGHERLLAAYHDASAAALGTEPEQTGFPSWADSSIMQAAGIPTLLVGAEGGNLHAIDEWASLPQAADLVAILEGAARRFCAGSSK